MPQLTRPSLGPWEVDVFHSKAEGDILIVTAEKGRRTICRVSPLDKTDTIDSANASLIADAPRMLTLLVDVRNVIAALLLDHPTSHGRDSFADLTQLIDRHT